MKKVVIVEKISTIREGIKILINRFSNHECEHTFADFIVFKKDTGIISADILLIDIEYKGICIADEIRKLKMSNPNLAIIVLTLNEENESIFEALSNGASAYVHKNAPPQKLIKVIDETASGKLSINSFIARSTRKFIYNKNVTGNYLEKEIKLLNMVTEGNNVHAIQRSLNMEAEEIKTTFSNIYNKLFELVKNDNVSITR